MISSSLLLILALKMAVGLLADRAFGEVRRFHPLVGFGRWAGWVARGEFMAAWACAVQQKAAMLVPGRLPVLRILG